MTGKLRKRNPRRIALAMLRAIRADAGESVSRWAVTGSVVLPPDERPAAGTWRRPRTAGEWPEWQAAQWHALDREARHMIEQLTEVREFARQQITALTCRRCGRTIPASEAAAGYTTCEHCHRPRSQ